MPAPDRDPPFNTSQLAFNPLKGIVSHYSAAEVDALLAALPAGGGTVDLSNYYDKPEVDAKVAALQQGVNDAELGVQSVADQIPWVAEQLASQLGDQIKLKADQATTYTKAEVDGLLVDAASGGTVDLGGYAKVEDLPIVYEQDAEPTGKDGDLWLGPEVTKEVTPVPEEAIVLEVQRVLESQPKTLTEPEVREIVRSMIAGGKEPPPDFDWTALVFSQGAGLIEAKQTNGVLLLRGELTFTYSAAGSYTTVRTLPGRLPKPTVDCRAVVTGKENGVAFRFVSVILNTQGQLQICATGGKITHVSFDGMIAYVC